MIAIGLMSGTSLDGVDAAVLDILPRGPGYALKLLEFQTQAFDRDLHAALLAALAPQTGSVRAAAELHRALGEAFAKAAEIAAAGRTIGFVASHGQTLWHDGDRSVTLQLGDAFVIRERLRATVCYDFRSADCAVGGHGAPLVPYVDALLFATPHEDRVALNLGGIANVTLLARDGDVVAFDTGPGNMVMDALVSARTGGATEFDRDGALAAAGRVDQAVLAALLADEYFARRPPKSTGRERFGRCFFDAHAPRLSALSLEDALATLAELTAASIASALHDAGCAPERAIVSGGGARNRHLLARLAARLSPAVVEPSDAMGIPAEAKEAIAFAVLGYQTLRERAGNVPAATGAQRATPLGAIAPYRLRDLLAEVDRECQSS